jgi:Fe-S cluster assembly ATP-binding protein
MLEIKNLHVSTDDKEILKGIDLVIEAGQIHAIMGPNGSGKSTLASVLAGKEGYTVTKGSITFNGKDLIALSPQERALAGIFLAFQYPVEIPGVSNTGFLKTMVNAQRQAKGEESLDSIQFKGMLNKVVEKINFPKELLERNLNDGFSGGEKKRNEILQMALLNPALKILDETDSGLDVDALKTVAQGINTLHSKESATIVITHYNRVLSYLDIDQVHILADGKIIKSGDKELAKQIEAEGYDKLIPKGPLSILN